MTAVAQSRGLQRPEEDETDCDQDQDPDQALTNDVAAEVSLLVSRVIDRRLELLGNS
jgi:hypothetical protein